MKTIEEISREAAKEMSGFVRTSWINEEYHGYDEEGAAKVIADAIREHEKGLQADKSIDAAMKGAE